MHSRISLLLLLLALDSRSGALAAPTNAPASSDFSSFTSIAQGNIFNSRRYRSPTRIRPQSTDPRPSRSENLALVGIMDYDKGPVAFFEGSNPEYEKAMKPAETIAGFTISNITTTAVKLVSGTNQFDLAVGMELRRRADENWKLNERAEPLMANAVERPQATTATGTESDTPPDEGDQPQATMVDPATGAPITSDSSTDAVAPNPDQPPPPAGGAMDVLTRLRLRRQQEDNR
jgi:hypothetical protein